MKVHVDFEMTPEEARKLMGLPDVSAMQKKLVAEMERRMMSALDSAADPEAMLKTWFGWGNQGLEQLQKFLRDNAVQAAKDRPR